MAPDATQNANSSSSKMRIQAILDYVDANDKTAEYLFHEERIERKKEKLTEDRMKLLEAYDDKKISQVTYNANNMRLLNEINTCEMSLQEIRKKILANKLYRERLKIVEEILTLNNDAYISLTEKYNKREGLFTELCNKLKNEALADLNARINITRLQKYQILFYKSSERTAAQNQALEELTHKLCALQNEADALKELISSNEHGVIRTIGVRTLCEYDGYNVAKVVFNESLLEAEKKRTA